MEKIQKSHWKETEATDSGHTALFTFGIKENLDSSERSRLTQVIRNLVLQPLDFQELPDSVPTNGSSVCDFKEQGRTCSATLPNPHLQGQPNH